MDKVLKVTNITTNRDASIGFDSNLEDLAELKEMMEFGASRLGETINITEQEKHLHTYKVARIANIHFSLEDAYNDGCVLNYSENIGKEPLLRKLYESYYIAADITQDFKIPGNWYELEIVHSNLCNVLDSFYLEKDESLLSGLEPDATRHMTLKLIAGLSISLPRCEFSLTKTPRPVYNQQPKEIAIQKLVTEVLARGNETLLTLIGTSEGDKRLVETRMFWEPIAALHEMPIEQLIAQAKSVVRFITNEAGDMNYSLEA